MWTLLLTGCAGVGTPPSGAPNTPPQFWQGRFAVVVHTVPKQSQRAGFELRGSAQNGQLNIISPIGTTVARAQWQPGKATLIRSGQYTDYANLAALSAALGEANLPVAALFSWLTGDPEGHLEKNGDLPLAHGGGWQADVCQAHVGKLKAIREQPAPAVSLTLVFEPPAKTAVDAAAQTNCKANAAP